MYWRALPVLTVALSIAPGPSAAAAQDWGQPWSDPRDRPPRVDISASAGVLAPTDWSDMVLLGSISAVSGVLEQVLVQDLRVKPDRLVGGAVTYWRGRHGFRVQGGWSRSSLEVGGASLGAGSPDGLLSPRVDTWLYDVRGAIGLVEYAPDRLVWPYAFVGFGGITYDLSRPLSPPLLTFIERSGSRGEARGDLVIAQDDGRQFLLAVDELGLDTVFALNFGAGADLRLPLGAGGVALRLELSDHVARSPVGLRIRELSPRGGLNEGSVVRFDAVHHFRASAGLVVQFGR